MRQFSRPSFQSRAFLFPNSADNRMAKTYNRMETSYRKVIGDQ
jgi:hypothetical protein